MHTLKSGKRFISLGTCLVLSLLAEVHNDLGGAGVEGVEVGPMLRLQTLGGEVVDAPQAIHKFSKMLTMFIILK